MKTITYVILFTFLLFTSTIIGQTCNGNTFTSPGAPATCTYSYTASGWDTVPPLDIAEGESVCILADLSTTDFHDIDGTIYIAPGVTFTGEINKIKTAVIEGTLDLTNSPGMSNIIFYVASTGTVNIPGNSNYSGSSIVHNAGSYNISGDLGFSGSSYIVNYQDAYLIVQGGVKLTGSTGITNCGILEIVTGDLDTSGSTTLQNECTTYVHNNIKMSTDYINNGVLIVDGTIDLNGNDLYNNNLVLVNNIVVDAENIIGNYYSSILIVRDRAQIKNGGSVTGHYYFDMNNGGGFDSVCGFCIEDIIILDNVVVPAVPAFLKADCGANIILDFPFCKVVEDQNTIYGSVFNDFNRNGALDSGEPVEENVTINLYSDLNSNGIIDGSDSVEQTTVTNLNGEYTFNVAPTKINNQVFTKRVDRLSDDAQQNGDAAVVTDNDEYKFKLGHPFVGIRINDIPIPRKSVIKDAKISFYSKDNQTGFLSYEISGQKIDNAQTFVTVNNNLSNRWNDSNKVSWFNMPDWSENTVYDTPDISSIVKSIISRYGWETNNSMAFIFRHYDGPNAERKAVSFEKNNATAAQLSITYDGVVPASYIVQIDVGTIPAGSSLTTTNNYSVEFPSINDLNCNNDFGFASPCNDPSGTDTDGDGVNNECDIDDDNDGILDVDECPDLGKPQILDGDFEYVNIVSSGLDDGPTDAATTSTGIWKGDAIYYPQWESADPVNNHLEIWQNGNTSGSDVGGSAYTGIQWVEVNASTNDGLYQDIATTPGDMLQWSFAHRKRREHIGSGAEDVMDLSIGDPSGSMVSQGNFTSANDASWTFYSGTYTVPVGQTTTRLAISAVSTVTGGAGGGNFIDSVQFYVIPNCEDTDSDTYPDYLDIDSDDDGIPDNVEGQPTIGYQGPTGAINAQSGLYEVYAAGLPLVDTDMDGIYDFRDPDTDSDGTPDIEENGMADVAGPSDTDTDGLNDVFETTNVSDASWDVNEDIEDPTDLSILPDVDGDRFNGGDLNYRDLLDFNPPFYAKIDFDGIDDHIEIPGSPLNTLDEFTLSCWMKLDEVLTEAYPAKSFVIGQKEMFEVNVGLDTSGDPSVWVSHFYGAGPDLEEVGYPIDNVNWVHITAAVSYITETIDIYVNGEQKPVLDISGKTRLTNSDPFRMGSSRKVQPDPSQENFKGWMDEIRIFNSVLTPTQIQQMTYQEIENNTGVVHGAVIDKDIIDPALKATIPWYNLILYYPMNEVINGDVRDASLYGNNGRLFNITSLEPQNAPMPYETTSGGDGLWTSENNWLFGSVWDIEDVANNKDWSIVHLHDDITTSASHTQLGMLIDAGATLTVTGDNKIENNWYFQLDGTLDLADDSQLIQTDKSDLVTSASGKILRRQEGNANYLWYNYWSSPVGALGATTLNDNNGAGNNTNNTPFALNMIKDHNGNPMEFTTAFNETGKISTRWVHTFKDGVTYYDWVNVDENTNINPGTGYTQKGTGIDTNPDPLITEQQYIFEGKPNNGTIKFSATDTGGPGSVEGSSFTSYLIGNPYPSALDADEFIRDNIDFDNGSVNPTIQGTILLWEQWAGNSHYLSQYEGGYGFINLTESVRAYQHPDIIISDPTNPDNRGIKTPTKFIPVGQAFFVEVVNDGDIEFNNGQRVFKQEDLNESVFFRSTIDSNTEASTEDTAAETQILRLEFGVSSGASRSFVIGFTEDATDGYDYGLDGGLINNPPADDMGSLLNGEQYVIQAFAPYTPDKEIDLVLHASGNYTYTLKSTEISNFPADQDLFLKDILTGQHYDLRSTEPYNFTSVAGSFTERFKVVFQDPEALATEEFISDNTLIYINQIEDKLYVKALETQAKQLSIINMLGQRVKTYTNLSNQTLENGISISDLNKGVYIIKLINNKDQAINKKVIID